MNDRPVISEEWKEAVKALVTEEMEIAAYSAWSDWSEDFEAPRVFAQACLAELLYAACIDPTTRANLLALLKSV